MGLWHEKSNAFGHHLLLPFMVRWDFYGGFSQLLSFFQRFMSPSGPGLEKSGFVKSSLGWWLIILSLLVVGGSDALGGSGVLFLIPIWGKHGFVEEFPWEAPVIRARGLCSRSEPSWLGFFPVLVRFLLVLPPAKADG